MRVKKTKNEGPSVAPRVARCSNNHCTEMCCGIEAGSYVRLIDSCITHLKAQGPSRTCNESKEEGKVSMRCPPKRCRARRDQLARSQRHLPQQWLRSRPEYGLDCLVCADFARQRTQAGATFLENKLATNGGQFPPSSTSLGPKLSVVISWEADNS